MAQVQIPTNGWKPRTYQLPLWRYLENGGKRAAVVWPRRHGKDYVMINWVAFASQRRVGTYWIVYPYLNQGRRIAWTGMAKDGSKFLDAFPEELIKSRQNAEMRLELKNGSVIQIMGADEPDRFVGSNPVGIVFSEWALMNPLVWKLTSPILTENGGWAVFIYTPRGTNHGLDTLNEARTTKGWYHSKLTAADCGVLTAEELRKAKAELRDEALFLQEFFTSFTVPLQGAYYFSQMKHLAKEKRLIPLTIEPALPVTTSWDLGVDDQMAIWFSQETRGGEIRLVHYYENTNEGLGHYVRYLKEWATLRGVVYHEHLAPHDIAVRELTTGRSRLETARSMGIKFRPVGRHGIEDGIEAVRNMLPQCWMDPAECKLGMNAIKSYTKRFDEDKGTFMARPEHNWASHAADALRTLAWGRRKPMSKKKKGEAFAQTDYDIFG